MVNAGHNYIGDVVDSDLAELVKAGKLRATTDFGFIKDVDFVAICVPTPLDAHQEPDISFVRDSSEAVAKYLKPETMVVLESTTYPGTTEELIKTILEKGSGLVCGKDFYLASALSVWIPAIKSITQRIPLKWWAVLVRMPPRSLPLCTARCWTAT